MAIKTILIIEDDRFIGEMYVRSLKKAGFEIEFDDSVTPIQHRCGAVLANAGTLPFLPWRQKPTPEIHCNALDSGQPPIGPCIFGRRK